MSAQLADFFFPPACLGCQGPLVHRNRPLFCDPCRGGIAWLTSPYCSCCGQPFIAGQSHRCSRCQQDPPSYDLARSAFLYQDPIASCLQACKFHGTLTGLASLGMLARQSPGYRELRVPDLILPVPLHLGRLRQRGFNQALLLARACFPEYRQSIESDLLLRVRPTVPQTSLSGKRRRRNLAGAFGLRSPAQVARRRILLVDDIHTTGSTVQACSQLLRQAGADRIEVFTLARVVVHH